MGRRRLRKRANDEGSVDKRSRSAKETEGYGRTQAQAIAKLDELKIRLAQSLPPKPTRKRSSFQRIRNHANIPKIRLHDLRHSAATILKMDGRDFWPSCGKRPAQKHKLKRN